MYLESFIDVSVVENPKDVLAGPVDGAAQQKVGKAEAEVVASQLVVATLEHGTSVYFCQRLGDNNDKYMCGGGDKDFWQPEHH